MSHKSPRIYHPISDEFLEIQPDPFVPYLFIETGNEISPVTGNFWPQSISIQPDK